AAVGSLAARAVAEATVTVTAVPATLRAVAEALRAVATLVPGLRLGRDRDTTGLTGTGDLGQLLVAQSHPDLARRNARLGHHDLGGPPLLRQDQRHDRAGLTRAGRAAGAVQVVFRVLRRGARDHP